LTSSSEKKRQVMSSGRRVRTSRIQTEVWYAHGHIGSKKNSRRVSSTAHLRAAADPGVSSEHMERPTRFEHSRFLGDKRTQLVYDLDTWTDEATIDELMAAETGLSFGPDTLAEARNRGYTLAEPGVRRRHRKPRA
jgi:hypothetical protein